MALSWADACAGMQAFGYRSVVGRMRYNDGQGREGESRFWHVAPDRWRVESSTGELLQLSDGRRQLVRMEGDLQEFSAKTWGGFGSWHWHPQSLLGEHHPYHPRFSDPNDFSVPLGPGVETTVAGRPAWEFSLAPPPRKPRPLRVAVDDATGAVLRMAVPEFDFVQEMVEFQPDVDIPDDVFTWDGPVSTSVRDEMRRDQAAQDWLSEQKFPVPRYWPHGVGHMNDLGDPKSGAILVLLEVPGYPALARWPQGTSLPDYWTDRLEGFQVHRWTTDRWQWALAISEEEYALADAELAKVIASIPEP